MPTSRHLLPSLVFLACGDKAAEDSGATATTVDGASTADGGTGTNDGGTTEDGGTAEDGGTTDDGGGTAGDGGTTGHGGECFAPSLNGTTDYVLVADTENALGVTNAVTISAWVWVPLEAAGARRPIFSAEWTLSSEVTAERNAGYMIAISSDGAVEFAAATGETGSDTSGGPLWTTPTPIPNDTWTHVAATRDGPTARIYVNGSLQFEDTKSATADLNFAGGEYEHDGYFIGHALPNGPGDIGSFFLGRVHDVAVYNAALSEAEIASIATTHPAADDSSLAGYWPMLLDGGPVADESGHGHDGAILGSPTWVADCP